MSSGPRASVEHIIESAAQAMKDSLPSVAGVLRESAGRGLTAEEQTIVARFRLAELALALPMASLGTCSQDGTDYQFEDHDGQMWVCCAHGHCWKTGWGQV
jgi:hypothetical protein